MIPRQRRFLVPTVIRRLRPRINDEFGRGKWRNSQNIKLSDRLRFTPRKNLASQSRDCVSKFGWRSTRWVNGSGRFLVSSVFIFRRRGVWRTTSLIVLTHRVSGLFVKFELNPFFGRGSRVPIPVHFLIGR